MYIVESEVEGKNQIIIFQYQPAFSAYLMQVAEKGGFVKADMYNSEVLELPGPVDVIEKEGRVHLTPVNKTPTPELDIDPALSRLESKINQEDIVLLTPQQVHKFFIESSRGMFSLKDLKQSSLTTLGDL